MSKTKMLLKTFKTVKSHANAIVLKADFHSLLFFPKQHYGSSLCALLSPKNVWSKDMAVFVSGSAAAGAPERVTCFLFVII